MVDFMCNMMMSKTTISVNADSNMIIYSIYSIASDNPPYPQPGIIIYAKAIDFSPWTFI